MVIGDYFDENEANEAWTVEVIRIKGLLIEAKLVVTDLEESLLEAVLDGSV